MDQNDAGFTGEQGLQESTDAAPQKPRRGRGVRLVDWLDDHLIAALGPPPIGPYGELSAQVPGTCPICSHPMGEHLIDHSTRNAVLHCPVAIDGPYEHVDDSPLNELGMPKHPAPEQDD